MCVNRIIVAAIISAAAMVPAKAETTVTFMGYPGLFETLYSKSVFDPFMKAHPEIKIKYYAAGDSAHILGILGTQKNAPQADLALLDVTVSKAGTDDGLFTPIDATVTPHYNDLYAAAKVSGVAGVGLTFDSSTILYNKHAFTTPPTSIKVFKEGGPKRRVGLNPAPNILGVGLTIIAERAAGGKDWNHNVDKGISELQTIAPNVLTWDPKPDVNNVILSGQVDLSFGFNARAQYYSLQPNSNLAAAAPEEGVIFQINTINLVKNAPQEKAARKVLDYMLSPAAQKAFAEAMYYAPTNSKTQVSQETMNRTVAGFMDRVIDVDWLEVAKLRENIARDWRRKIIPLSK